MDIEDHVWLDEDIEHPEEGHLSDEIILIVNDSNHRYSKTTAYIFKDDVIAMAKHFKLKPEDLD